MFSRCDAGGIIARTAVHCGPNNTLTVQGTTKSTASEVRLKAVTGASSKRSGNKIRWLQTYRLCTVAAAYH